MHRAPVVSICVLDGRGKPLPDPYEASQDLAIAPDMTNAHSVLIASEEQLKVKDETNLCLIMVTSNAADLNPGSLALLPGVFSPQSEC